jgi:hypothetical protein
VQRAVPDEVMARVFGVVQSVFVGTLGLGAILAPVLIELLGIRGALLASGGLLPVLAVLYWRRLQRIDAEALAPSELALLSRLAIFRPLPPATINQLSAGLIAVHATAGEQIIREGERGDRFYVIGKGEVDVSAEGRHMATLGEADYFGEIALLRDVPRTATVTATTDVRLLALAREPFLEAVTGHPQSLRVAGDVTRARASQPTATP